MKPGLSLGNKLSFAAGLLGAAVLAPSALAQFNNQWLTLTQDFNRLKTPVGTNADIVPNGDEKDFAMADVNKDGWTDLAVGKKVQVSFPGPREGRLFINEHGTLVDRTQQYATASLSAGDNGFKNLLDCRDVEFADLDGDTWLDMVSTQTDLSNQTAAAAKRTTHPRVYMNLGNDGSGNWLGFRHEDARIPQLLTIPGGVNGVVRFCDSTIGDVDLDGDMDMYFVDYDTDENGHSEPGSLDLNDRLLINDGNGFFTDETASRFNNTGMWSSAFGTECEFEDLNGDGKLDIVKLSTLTDSPNRTEVSYNNISAVTQPNFTGGWDVIQSISTGEDYTMAHADINNDGRIDHLVGDDATDHFYFNTGNDAIGRVVWSTAKNYTWLSGSGEDGFPGQMYGHDFNLDGWADCIITDVDLDLAGCNRRTKIYHNSQGTVGGQDILLREEKQQSGSGGWFGAIGWSGNYPRGVNDAGLIDIDHDGDTDIVLGKCDGTHVWMNQTNPVSCALSVFPTSLGDGTLSVCGQPLWQNLSATLNINNGPASGVALLLVGFTPSQAPAFGGQVLVPFALSLVLPLDGSGSLAFPVPGGSGTAAGLDVYIQALLAAPAGVTPTDITNVVKIVLFS
jgi:hypothetical protein